ncbi:Ankyrin repeat-containing domain [Phytophthora cactorum]|nr:Ankyrin repeat-containing domain [Phytophthora cactorum]
MRLPPTATTEDVHAAWLAAGANEDVATMRQLRSQFPEWLDFQRQVGSATSDSLPERQARFCSWNGFHLRSLGILEFLLESGQSPDESDDSGVTAIMVTILRLNLMTMRCVLRDGEADGKTALHCSTFDDAYEVAKCLLDAGATITAYKDGISPLELMLQRANVTILQLFLNHHHCVATPHRHDFAEAVLLQAVDTLEEKMVFYILENEYASVAVRNSDGETTFHRAIIKRSSSLMELLADFDSAGDNLVATTVNSETPTHYAAKYGSHRVVETLLQCLTSVFGDLQELGAANPLNTVNQQGMTSLYIAATTPSRCNIDLVDLWGIRAATNVERNSKTTLLLHHGARLFPLALLVQTTSDSSRMILPLQVQHCLRTWLVEGVWHGSNEEPEDEETAHTGPNKNMVEALTELCVRWMSSVTCSGSWASLLPIFICAGYAHEFVPLLVELPLETGQCQFYYVSWRSLRDTSFATLCFFSFITNYWKHSKQWGCQFNI